MLHTAGRLVMAAVLAACSATPARAEGIFTPWFGSARISGAGAEGDAESRATYGLSVGSYGRVGGFELDFGYTPEFFGDSDLLGTNNVITLMANLVIGPEIGRVRPYVLGGAGLLRSRIEGPGEFFDISSNDFGVSFGGGLYGFLTDSIGIRGDLRYFRNVSSEGDGLLGVDLGDFDFWRVSGGLAIGF